MMKKELRILLLDDDETARNELSEALSSRQDHYIIDNMGCKEFSSLQKKTLPYDCIITDFFFRDAPGADIIARLTGSENVIPVIVTTSRGDELAAVEAIKAGAFDYLPRPAILDETYLKKIGLSIVSSLNYKNLEQEKRNKRIALELSEERYRGLIEHSAMLIIRFFKDDLMINFVNDGFCSYYGVDRFEMLGEDVYIAIDPRYHTAVSEMIKTISLNNPRLSFEHSIMIQGAELWQIWTIQAIFDEHESILEYQCMGEDITEIKKIQHELENTLDKIQQLKNQQDGDYFLTSLLLEPLGGNNSDNSSCKIDVLVKQKKEFNFRGRHRDLGGDICYAKDIVLRQKIFTLFLNGDAMGKSLQGAGGAIVLGAVLRAIIERSAISVQARDRAPEQWLRDAFIELHRVFESFDGSMLISIVLGLYDTSTGLVYYINAEHPWGILIRAGKAQFTDNTLDQRKLGISFEKNYVKIKLLQMQPGEILLVGSDGRDDIDLGNSDEGNRIINEDENLFLRIAEKCRGDLRLITDELKKNGDITDDLSLLSLTCTRTGDDSHPLSDEEMSACRETIRTAADSGTLADNLNRLEVRYDLMRRAPVVVRDILEKLIRDKQFIAANFFIEEYLERVPSDTSMLHLAAYSFKKTGDLVKARELAERAFMREPENDRYGLNLGMVYEKLNRYSYAKLLCSEMLTRNPDNSRVKNLYDRVCQDG